MKNFTLYAICLLLSGIIFLAGFLTGREQAGNTPAATSNCPANTDMLMSDEQIPEEPGTPLPSFTRPQRVLM
ncbi:hypothetical protein [Undibacterium rugosum]|uniref:Uncharacterized protein n=1 Tax=Undibacterium rugosum TaxID=2762291 RepID=A0A923KYW7_9BURK|nr:hypothetical protein [Undibacterium rugosum]MBC3935105.1 hypothetical protein [Undibacterium rugosum]MBR7780040.1 hypothetical protein [Undibacterium rugosum]